MGINMSSATLVSANSVKQTLKSAQLLATAAAVVTGGLICAHAEPLSLDCDLTEPATGRNYPLRVEIDDNRLCEIRENNLIACFSNKKEPTACIGGGIPYYTTQYFRSTPIQFAWGAEIRCGTPGFFGSNDMSKFDSTIDRVVTNKDTNFRMFQLTPRAIKSTEVIGVCKKATVPRPF
jgi:hypothetical protein